MTTIVLFVVAAGVAAVARSLVIAQLNHEVFPWGTLAVNVSGSLAAGIVAAHAPAVVTTVAGVAALGAFTTFSTFAVEAAAMWTDRRRVAGAGYVMATTVLAVGAAAVGLGL